MSYTDQDVANAITYANERGKLIMIGKMYDAYPNIASHLLVNITQADKDEDYYYTNSFKNKAILVNIEINQELCELLSCNVVKEQETCTPLDHARYLRIGNQEIFERVCQPSCFHLLDKPVLDDDGNQQSQMMRLNYTEKYGCTIQPPALPWFEHPYYRSNEQFDQRLNDLPYGFNLGEYDEYTSSGKTYTYNEMYCSAYFDSWDAEALNCYTPWYLKIANAVVGESIIKMARAGIELIKNGFESSYPAFSFPDPPIIEENWMVENWKKNINPDFVVPDENFEFPDSTFRKDYNFNKTNKDQQTIKKNIIRKLKLKQNSIASSLREKLEKAYTVEPSGRIVKQNLTAEERNQIKLQEYRRTVFNNKRSVAEDAVSESEQKLQKMNTVEEDNSNFIENILVGLLESMTTPEFWATIGVDYISDVALSKIKKVALKAMNKLIPKLTKQILEASAKLFTKVFAKSVFAVLATTISKVVIKSVSKVMVTMCKMIAEASTVIGIVLVVISVFDIILTFWDPLGFNNKFDPTILKSVMRESDKDLRTSLAMANPALSFDMLSNMIMSTDDIMEAGVHMFMHVYGYLDSLTVNSEGSRIDKGTEMSFDDSGNAVNDEINKNIATTKLYTPNDFYNYEFDHSVRMNFFNHSKKYAAVLCFIGVSFLITDLYILGVFFLILCIVLIFLTYINTTSYNMGKVVNQIPRFYLF